MIDDDELYGLHCDIGRLEQENAKLREEVEQWHRLTAGIELPEYPITEFKPKDLERENAKLRELVTAQCECVKHDDCSKCVHYSEDKCMFPFKVMYRELGIEVG